MSSYLEGLRYGSDLVQGGFDEFDRARRWSHMLTAEAAAKQAKQDEVHREEDRFQTERGDKKQEAERRDAEFARKQAEEERHNLAMEGIDKNRWPSGGRAAAQIPPEVRAAMANRDNARKSISALAAGGIVNPPPEMQAKLDAAEGALARVAAKNKFDLGEDAAATAAFHASLAEIRRKAAADAEAKAHPIANWFKGLSGSPSTPSTPAAPGGAKPAWMQYDDGAQ